MLHVRPPAVTIAGVLLVAACGGDREDAGIGIAVQDPDLVAAGGVAESFDARSS